MNQSESEELELESESEESESDESLLLLLLLSEELSTSGIDLVAFIPFSNHSRRSMLK